MKCVLWIVMLQILNHALMNLIMIYFFPNFAFIFIILYK